ncbi:MAG: addiction module protein, partial [Blastocatellia bacterium]
MTIELEKLKGELMTLPIESRAWLAQTLVQSLDQTSDADVTDLWLKEIRRRDAEISSGTAVCKPAAQMLQEAQDML